MDIYEPLNFTKNWNGKLGCEYFTTIRLHDPKKYAKGIKKTVFLNKAILSNVEIFEVFAVKFAYIKPWMKIQDTGLMPDKFDGMFHTMYKNKVTDWNTQLFDVMLLRTIQRFEPLPYEPVATSL